MRVSKEDKADIVSDLKDQFTADQSTRMATLEERLDAQSFETQHLRSLFTEERLGHLNTKAELLRTKAELKEYKDAAEVKKAGDGMNTEASANTSSNPYATFATAPTTPDPETTDAPTPPSIS